MNSSAVGAAAAMMPVCTAGSCLLGVAKRGVRCTAIECLPAPFTVPGESRVTARTVAFETCSAENDSGDDAVAPPFDNIAHAARCPAYHGTHPRGRQEGAAAYPLLAASVLILDAEGRVLLTRRPAHMRTFPLHYVVPGGGCDPGETLWQTARREVLEETGIRLPVGAEGDAVGPASGGDAATPAPCRYAFGSPVAPAEPTDGCDLLEGGGRWDVSWFGAWESCFPVEPSDEPPKRHHIVAFFIARQRAGSGPPRITLSDECDDAVWVNPAAVADGSHGLLLAEGTRYMVAQVARWRAC